MPYSSEFVPAERFFTHQGVSIYFVYKDDDISQGARTYWFDNREDSSDGGGFDVRDLANNPKVKDQAAGHLDPETETGRKQILIQAIEAGLIQCGDEEEDI